MKLAGFEPHILSQASVSSTLVSLQNRSGGDITRQVTENTWRANRGWPINIEIFTLPCADGGRQETPALILVQFSGTKLEHVGICVPVEPACC